MAFLVHSPARRLRAGTPLILAACAVAGLCFAARGQQPLEPGPGETPPAIDANDTTPGEQMGEPEELNASDIAKAVGEAEAELDAGVADHPAQIQQVPAAATNAVVQHVDHPQGLALWKKARIVSGAYVAKTADGKPVRLTVEPKLQASMDEV